MPRGQRTWNTGDRAWLAPNLPTAPTEAYRQPMVTITDLNGHSAEVELPDGRRLWTNRRNLNPRPPQLPRPNLPTPPTSRLVLTDNETETTLW